MTALGSQSGISKSRVSGICVDFGVQVQVFLNRSLEASGYAYLHQHCPACTTVLPGYAGASRAVVVAMGGNADGCRVLLGNYCKTGFFYKVGESDSEDFWTEFIGSLIAAG